MTSSSWRHVVTILRRTPRFLIVQKAVRHIPFRPLDVGKLCFLRFEGVPHIAPSMLRGRATVRRGTSADIAELERLQNRGEIFDERFANGDHGVVALADGRIVGYEWFCDAEMHHETAWGYPIAIPRGLVYVYDAYIDAARRNSGVWLRFKAYLRDWMIATGKRGVLTFVEDGNLSSLRTHLRFGFTPTETVLAVKVFGVSRFRKVSDTSV